ncbi:hypothetical protein [Metabacillus sp. cB07]|uniref:hypothetical protein n=1 Tax=Metabacillus sp. cB07 TaxID=2806989 RepID=UPI0019398455|nr:hypothetical protein [Metabacillus sp. cB07]
MKIKDFREMSTLFEDVLDRNHQKFKNNQVQATNQLKSYIIENHISKSNDKEKYIHKFFAKLNAKIRKVDFQLKSTEESNFFINHSDSDQGDIYIDTSNDRYWVLHSISKAEFSDYFHSSILKMKNVDQMWLPIPFLLGLKKFGNTYGLGVSFTEYLKREEIDDLILDNQDTLNMNIKRLYVEPLISLLMRDEQLKTIVGINKISLLSPTNESDKSYIVDDITFNGKITAKGNSYFKHEHILKSVLQTYENKVFEIENKYSLNFNTNKNMIDGRPIEISLNRKDIDLIKLIEILFAGKKPFNLWGIPDWVNENFCRVSAVDLHMGNFGKTLEFEISKDKIVVVLPLGSCGNSVARLLTNIHQSIDATSVMKGDSGSEFFEII